MLSSHSLVLYVSPVSVRSDHGVPGAAQPLPTAAIVAWRAELASWALASEVFSALMIALAAS